MGNGLHGPTQDDPPIESPWTQHCAKRTGGTLATIFVDVAGGRRDTRPKYRRVVRRALAGEADVIAVQFPGRFERSLREALRRVWQPQEERGTTFAATDEDLKEELVRVVRAGVAGAESRRISG